VHSATGRPEPIQILERFVGITVLPGIEPLAFTMLQQFDHSFRRMPFELMSAQQPVEMGVPIDRIPAHDQSRHLMFAQLNGGQQRIRRS
jgi:hypothetical protein